MLKKIFICVIFILAVLTLVAMASLLLHDYKEQRWFHSATNTSKQQTPNSQTIVCILATVHQETTNYNADSIVAILNQFQPNLILTEEDTMLFETYHKSYNQTLQRSFLARLGRSFGFGRPEEIEGRAVRKYKISHPAVHIKPFDYEGRNAFYIKHNIFTNESEVDKRLERLASNGSLTPKHVNIWTDYQTINSILYQLNRQTPYTINRPNYYTLTEQRQIYQYSKVADIVTTNDSLKAFRNFYKTNAEFWDTRNKKMAEHIANFVSQYPNKRIMVLTGSMHKYYLLKELAPLQNRFEFKLKEYYE